MKKFDENNQEHHWQDEVAADLNVLIHLSEMLDPVYRLPIENIVSRVADYEDIERVE